MIIEQNNRRRLQPYAWEEINSLPKRKPLIKGLLDRSTMSLVYGPSNCGKTFIVLDMALHITLDRRWRNHKVKHGAVIYIAAEGGIGINERLEAFHKHYRLNGHAPFYLLPAGIDLCNEQIDTEELIYEINAIQNVEMIVIDTLSRAMAGGNENSSDDMGAFIRNCDKIKERTKAHVMIIHHAGKDAARGARGHSALRAAVDTEIEVMSDNGIITAEIKKQRDGRVGDKYSFTLTPVVLGRDDDGEDQTSCVLTLSNNPVKKKASLSTQASRALGILRDCIIDKGEERHVRQNMPPVLCITLAEAKEALRTGKITSADNPDSISKAATRAIDALNDKMIIRTYGDYIWFADRNDNIGQTKLYNSH